MEGPTTREKKSHRPAPGKEWDGGSLGRRQTTTDDPQSPRELKQRVLDAAWEAIGDALSPPRAKGLAALREAKKPKGLFIREPIGRPHTERRSHHGGELTATHKDNRLKCLIRPNTFRGSFLS